MMTIIFIESATPGPTIKAMGLGKESIHVNGHFLLFFLLGLAFYKSTKSIVKSILFTILYGFVDEFHQRFTPFRSASFFDITVDAIGALTAGVILWILKPYLPKKLKNWLEN